MPAATKMSSQPSALRSSTLGPQGQYVSSPSESDTSSNRPPPRFANSAFPKMNRPFPSGKKSAGAGVVSALRASAAQSPGGTSAHMSEHTSELQSRLHLVCRLLLEKKKKKKKSKTVK